MGTKRVWVSPHHDPQSTGLLVYPDPRKDSRGGWSTIGVVHSSTRSHRSRYVTSSLWIQYQTPFFFV